MNHAAVRALAMTRWIAKRFMMEIILVIICVWLAFNAPNFLTVNNFFSIIRSVATLGLIAFGMTMVIIAKEIDLSVGSAVAFGGCLMAYLTQQGLPIPAGILLTVVTGSLFGCFTGAMRVYFGVPSFITSLGLLTAMRGLALMLTGGFPLTPFPEGFRFLGAGTLFHIPVPAILFILAFAGAHFVMRYTTFGAAVYAVGGNAEAARLSGINVNRVRILVFAITGGLAGMSGVLLASRMMSGVPTVAQGWELDVIAAVIIGGASFTGGVGSVRGALVGIIFIGVIMNGMTLMNVPVYTQYVMRGALILAAVLMNQLQERWA